MRICHPDSHTINNGGSLNLLFGQILTVDPNNGLIINGTLTDEDGAFTIETGGYVEVK